MSEETRPLVITVHGVESHGEWQRWLAGPLQIAGFNNELPTYGRFLILQLMIPWVRARKIKWFLDVYTTAVQAHGDKCPSVVAHSLGTYIVTRALEKYKEIKIKRLILCGSIVRYTYNWSRIIERGQVEQVFNDYGGRDLVVRLSPWAVSNASPTGFHGFKDLAGGRVIQEKSDEYGHSTYFYGLHFTDTWIPFLKGDNRPAVEPLAAYDEKRRWNWRYTIFLICVFSLSLGGARWAVRWYQCHDWSTDSGSMAPLALMPTVRDDHFPANDLILAQPRIKADDAIVKVQNDSGRNLTVFLYPCEDRLNAPTKTDGDGWWVRWIRNGEFEKRQGLEVRRTRGSYLLYAQCKCDPEPIFCGVVNLLDERRPTIHIKPGVDRRYEVATSYEGKQ